jgi:uncharacterized membrane protein
MTLKIFLLIILHEICATFEQIFFKKSANKLGDHSLKSVKDYFIFIKTILKMPLVWLAFLATAASWLVWFTVLAGVELSIAIPVDSMQYIIIVIISYFVFKERMHWTRIVGTLFIILGITIVVFS